MSKQPYRETICFHCNNHKNKRILPLFFSRINKKIEKSCNAIRASAPFRSSAHTNKTRKKCKNYPNSLAFVSLSRKSNKIYTACIFCQKVCASLTKNIKQLKCTSMTIFFQTRLFSSFDHVQKIV